MAEAGADQCTIAVVGGWRPAPLEQAEMRRLAGEMPFEVRDCSSLDEETGQRLFLSGISPPASRNIRMAIEGRETGDDGLWLLPSRDWRAFPLPEEQLACAKLDSAAKAIVRATAKPGDGIVSRYINRPISQSISRLLLLWPGMRPIHATIASALIALAMLAFLLTGTHGGAIVGAVLFQVASVIDGVDGEIARATFRSSPAGAKADSLVDAATNVAFIGGIAANLWMQGNQLVAAVGGAGLILMAVGLFIIGRHTRKRGGAFTFNAVKHHFNDSGSHFKQWLVWLTMRDFIALAAVAFVVAGFASIGLLAFAAVAAGWFVVVVTVLHRQSA